MKVTPRPALHSQPSTTPAHYMQKASPGNHNASVAQAIPDVGVRSSVKSIREREIVPAVKDMPLSQHPRNTHNMPSTTSVQHPKSVPIPVFKASRHHQMINVLTIPSKKPALEQVPPPNIQEVAINEQFSDTCSIPLPNSVHPLRVVSPIVRNNFQHNQITDSDSVSSAKASSPKEAARPIVQNNSASHPPVQKLTKPMANPTFQREGIVSNPRETFRSTKYNEVNLSRESNNTLALKASHNEQSKIVGLPPARQDDATPTHCAKPLRFRQKSSNQ